MAAQVQTENLNFKAFMSSNAQQTPPSSGRTTLSVSSAGSSAGGGGTTRRSFLFNTATMSYNGNYEGDFTMFDNITKMTLNATPRHPKQKILEQLFDSDLNLNLEQDNRCDDIEPDVSTERMDLEEKGKDERPVESEDADKEKESKAFWGKVYWHSYKSKLFSELQHEKIEDFIEKVQEHPVYRKMRTGLKLLLAMLMLLVNYVVFNLVVATFNKTCNAWHTRNALRNSARSILWYMTLAKYGDLRLFGLIAILTPVTFAIGVLGFMASLYCHIKDWIYRITGYVRLHMLASENE